MVDANKIFYSAASQIGASVVYVGSKTGRDALIEKFSTDPISAKFEWKAKTVSEISDLEQAQKLMKMIDALEDCDDVQAVTGNYSFTNEIAEKL